MQKPGQNARQALQEIGFFARNGYNTASWVLSTPWFSEAKLEIATCYRTFLFASSMTFSADFLSLDRLRERHIHFDNHIPGER